jgi:hypothetical protein
MKKKKIFHQLVYASYIARAQLTFYFVESTINVMKNQSHRASPISVLTIGAVICGILNVVIRWQK